MKVTGVLERIYAAWKSAMASQDLNTWAKYTAKSRQMAVRNSIVSQKRDWPRALFSLALTPPEIEGLRLAGSEILGDQARLVYDGQVDFRLGDPRTPPAAALVLDFVREEGDWRFYGGRYYNLQTNPALARQLTAGEIAQVSGPQAALTGRAPPMPKPCDVPDYAGQIRVASYGYATTVELGDFHRDTIVGQATNEVVIGGLRRGTNPLRVSTQPLNEVGPEDRSLEISVFAITPHLRTPAVRVFHFQPNNPVGTHFELSVNVGAATLREGNEIELLPGK
ncbi:MAG: hypothetical protein ACR2OZ_07790 [Verrucomicrobiales bacterium]